MNMTCCVTKDGEDGNSQVSAVTADELKSQYQPRDIWNPQLFGFISQLTRERFYSGVLKKYNP